MPTYQFKRIPEELWKRFKKLAVDRETNARAQLIQSVEEFIERHKGEGG